MTESGDLLLGISQEVHSRIFPAYLMCPSCGHYLCQNETLTGVELVYNVSEKSEDGSWIESSSLQITKQVYLDEPPTVSWTFDSTTAVGKTFLV